MPTLAETYHTETLDHILEGEYKQLAAQRTESVCNGGGGELTCQETAQNRNHRSQP